MNKLIASKEVDLIDDLVARAQDMKAPWRPQATNQVKEVYEQLSEVIWQGRQWCVTTFGIERRDGGYYIEKNRLWFEEDKFGWIRHLACKSYVDLDDFTEALRIARAVHAPR